MTRLPVRLACVVLLIACARDASAPATSPAVTTSPASPNDWQVTGGEPGNTHYSSLDQITRANVKQLRVAWTFHTCDSLPPRSEIQATPIVVNGVMYTTTPALKVVALRADSGTVLWSFDPFVGRPREAHANRGVVDWSDGATARRNEFSLPPRAVSTHSTPRPADPSRRSATQAGLTMGVDLAAMSATRSFSPPAPA